MVVQLTSTLTSSAVFILSSLSLSFGRSVIFSDSLPMNCCNMVFSETPISSAIKTDRQDIGKILLLLVWNITYLYLWTYICRKDKLILGITRKKKMFPPYIWRFFGKKSVSRPNDLFEACIKQILFSAEYGLLVWKVQYKSISNVVFYIGTKTHFFNHVYTDY